MTLVSTGLKGFENMAGHDFWESLQHSENIEKAAGLNDQSQVQKAIETATEHFGSFLLNSKTLPELTERWDLIRNDVLAVMDLHTKPVPKVIRAFKGSIKSQWVQSHPTKVEAARYTCEGCSQGFSKKSDGLQDAHGKWSCHNCGQRLGATKTARSSTSNSTWSLADSGNYITTASNPPACPKCKTGQAKVGQFQCQGCGNDWQIYSIDQGKTAGPQKLVARPVVNDRSRILATRKNAGLGLEGRSTEELLAQFNRDDMGGATRMLYREELESRGSLQEMEDGSYGITDEYGYSAAIQKSALAHGKRLKKADYSTEPKPKEAPIPDTTNEDPNDEGDFENQDENADLTQTQGLQQPAPGEEDQAWEDAQLQKIRQDILKLIEQEAGEKAGVGDITGLIPHIQPLVDALNGLLGFEQNEQTETNNNMPLQQSLMEDDSRPSEPARDATPEPSKTEPIQKTPESTPVVEEEKVRDLKGDGRGKGVALSNTESKSENIFNAGWKRAASKLPLNSTNPMFAIGYVEYLKWADTYSDTSTLVDRDFEDTPEGEAVSLQPDWTGDTVDHSTNGEDVTDSVRNDWETKFDSDNSKDNLTGDGGNASTTLPKSSRSVQRRKDIQTKGRNRS